MAGLVGGKRVGRLDERDWKAAEFSREFGRLAAPYVSEGGTLSVNSRENLTTFGIHFAGNDVVMFNYERMKNISKVLMRYLYRREWKEKCVTVSEIAEWTKRGRYKGRVDAARGLKEVAMEGGMVCGPLAVEELPMVMPSQGEKGQYTGLVLLSFRVEEGVETLERLRRAVNLWPQTLLSFVGATGRSLEVVLPYRLVGGGVPAAKPQGTMIRILRGCGKPCRGSGSTSA